MAPTGMLLLCFAVLAVSGGINIKECSQGWVEIRENIPQSITCEGFSNTTYTLAWILFSKGIQQRVYYCLDTKLQCTPAHSDVNVTRYNQGSRSYSVLTINSNHRSLAGNGQVSCRGSQSGDITSCKTNVVHPAAVTNCTISTNNTDHTASGSCHYQKAYSSNDTYTCDWYRQLAGQSSRDHVSTGTLTKTEQTTDGQLFYRGVCRLPPSPLPVTPGLYTYTVDILPGSGNWHVQSIIIQSSTSASTTPASTPESSTSASTTPASTPDLTTPSPFTTTSPVTTSSTAGSGGGGGGVPQEAVIGGVVAAVAVVLVIVVIVVVIVKRKRRQKSEESGRVQVHAEAAPADSDYTFLDPIRPPGEGHYAVFRGPGEGQEVTEPSAVSGVLGGGSPPQTTSGCDPSTTVLSDDGENQQTSSDYEITEPWNQTSTLPEDVRQSTSHGDYYNTQ